MNKILVTYATMAGSTAEVAQAVGEEIAKSGLQVEILPLGEVKDLEAYVGVVVGAPMIMGWHRSASHFLKKHRAAFQRIPLAIFVSAMSLTRTGETSVEGVPVWVDEKLPKAPVKEGNLNFRERYARLSNYLSPILRSTRPARPWISASGYTCWIARAVARLPCPRMTIAGAVISLATFHRER